ncbi:MAG: hypothetical protein CO150_08535 [Nitrospirae bacterium CG_4_9_14_3_um_filter_53_35]|nr:MAG: hypothetical protein CO150_08535 [Nitrospirae bacterium CG_4_9_14_3_um_filter_53_35]
MKEKSLKRGLLKLRITVIRRGTTVHSEQGIVLVMVLILAAISLAFMSALMLMVTSSAQISGGHKRFASACEAAEAGAQVARQMVDAQDAPNVSASLASFSLRADTLMSGLLDQYGTPMSCLDAKLKNGTSDWSATCNDSLIIDPADSATYDMSFDLGSSPTYSIYSKIVDTVQGNTGSDPNVEQSTGVVNSINEIQTVPVPLIYTIEVIAQAQTGTAEKCRISMLYKY